MSNIPKKNRAYLWEKVFFVNNAVKMAVISVTEFYMILGAGDSVIRKNQLLHRMRVISDPVIGGSRILCIYINFLLKEGRGGLHFKLRTP